MSEYAEPADRRRPPDTGRSESPARRQRAKGLHLPGLSERHTPCDCNLTFESVGAEVPLAIVEHSPTMLVAAVEDLCWRLGVQSWSEREPARADHRAHSAWKAEARRFDEKSARIQEMVDEALMAS